MFLHARQMTHHKVVSTDGVLYLMFSPREDGLEAVALRFDEFVNAMDFVKDVHDGIFETWSAEYDLVEKLAMQNAQGKV